MNNEQREVGQRVIELLRLAEDIGKRLERARRAIERLNAINGGDLNAHDEADGILLELVPAAVREAYLAARARCEWWASA